MLENLMMNENLNHSKIQDKSSKNESTNSNNSKDDAAHKIANSDADSSRNNNSDNDNKYNISNNSSGGQNKGDNNNSNRKSQVAENNTSNVGPKNEQVNEQPDKKEGKSNEEQENEKLEKQNEDLKDKKISEYGQTLLENGKHDHKIHLLSIIGEIEGHECLPQHNKTTKYEHVLPQLAAIEDSNDIDGLLILINTVGGDVEAGLAIAEMIASLSKPTVSLVLGGSHSIGVPLAVSADFSYIVPSATMIIHPVRMNGMVIGVTQTFEYFEKIQDRIINFVVRNSKIDYESFRGLMLDTKQLAKDVGSILVGSEAVEKGIIDGVGGIKEALNKINEMIDERADNEEA